MLSEIVFAILHYNMFIRFMHKEYLYLKMEILYFSLVIYAVENAWFCFCLQVSHLPCYNSFFT